jgi:hypothetical protein
MTEHPITPPPELVSKWCHEDGEEIKLSPRWFFSVCAKAAHWGADQQLLKDSKWLDHNALNESHLTIIPGGESLIQAMRPGPLSLKEQALHELGDAYDKEKIDDTTYDIIHKALKALPND